jgi:hypothetical protein
MSSVDDRTFSHHQLDRLTGELLPPRTVLSVAGPQRSDPGHTGGHHGSTTVYACQAVYEGPTPGLLGTGLFSRPSYSSLTCVPAVVYTY